MGAYVGPRRVRPFLCYAATRAKERAEDALRWEYVAEAIRLAPQQKYPTKHLRDMLHQKPQDTRSGDEIAADVIKAAGLELV